jgi:cation:H+ antiporter
VEIPFSLLAVAVTGVLAHNYFTGSSGLILGRMDGAVFLLLFGFFWYYTLRLTVKSKKSHLTMQKSSLSITKSVLFIIVGIIGLFLGGKWVVDGAVSIAKALHISEGLIAISLVAVGTSLPELATSISAARKKKAGIITGNAIGSNIFNILWVLGLSSVIRPIPYNRVSDMDIAANLAVGILMLLFLYTGRKSVLSRFHGFLFLLAYAVYIGLSITFRAPGVQ